ncbi:MAG: aminomethyl-transferring glycine dehydrogenase subunit GcvPA [Gammaproteobacteria bacterium]|nr:MAG: aminomethyl-transferring glycine dehydrogenase subunit GcvPA [Gammaproteobacteria bacterium]
MPYIPHTEEDRRRMLEAVGAASVEELFAEIPQALRRPVRLPPGLARPLSEQEVARLMRRRAAADAAPGGLPWLCFAGAGAYEHHIPAPVWEIAARGEYYTAYTPYQAEASQGTLQLIYEFQSMMAALTGLEVANASLYDGASALAEALLMAVRAHRPPRGRPAPRRVLVPATVHPRYREVVRTLLGPQGIEVAEPAPDPATGRLQPAALAAALEGEGACAVVLPQPNYFGLLEEVHALADAAHQGGALVVGLVNPVALALLEPPGGWGARGADIAVGEGQPLGAPLSAGGPYFGFLCCRRELVRQMPGRLVGRTVDAQGREGYVLTLQAREQHIRRSKATSNICTNQGLMVTAAAVHLALLGPEGLRRVAARCHANLRALVEGLSALPGVEPLFPGPCFHEAALRLPRPAEEVLEALLGHGILGGVPLGPDYPELGEGALLVCTTETRTPEDLAAYREALGAILGA